ncbi:unnamed protein product, partial [Ectocarpus sp. 12 AP-2014]
QGTRWAPPPVGVTNVKTRAPTPVATDAGARPSTVHTTPIGRQEKQRGKGGERSGNGASSLTVGGKKKPNCDRKKDGRRTK